MHSTYPAGTFPKLMRDEITAPPPGVPVDSHAVYSKDTGGAAPSLPALPASFSFNLFYLCFFPSSFFSSSWSFFSPLLPPPFQCSSYTRGEGERDSFQLVWSLRASVYPLQKAALNLRRNLLRPGSFKEEFSSYWRRIFLLALTR